MRLRESLRDTVGTLRRQPELLAVGAGVTIVQTVAVLAGSGLARTIAGPESLLTTVGQLAGLLLTLPLYAALYVPADRAPGNVRATVDVAARAVGRNYRRLLGTYLWAGAVTALIGLATALGWFVVTTGVRLGRYALAEPHAPYGISQVYPWMAALFLGLLAGGLCTRFVDVFTLLDERDSRQAWRSSIRFVGLHPLSFLGYGAIVTTLGLTPVAVVTLLDQTGEAFPELALAGVALAFGTTALTLTAVFQVAYFRRAVSPAVAGSPAPFGSVSRGRVTLAALVLVAAVGGAAVVRTVDLGAGPHGLQPLPDDPQQAYAMARTNTAGANHRITVLHRNESLPDDDFTEIQRSAIDYDDRQLYVYLGNDERWIGGYYAEGTLAMYNAGGRASGLFTQNTENWTVLPAPGYSLTAEGPVDGGGIIGGDVNWTVVADNHSTLVVRVTDSDVIREVLAPEAYLGQGENMTDDSHVTAYVDRERGVVYRAEAHLHSLDTDENWRYVFRYEDIGTADVKRPDVFGPRNALEWAWDVLYY